MSPKSPAVFRPLKWLCMSSPTLDLSAIRSAAHALTRPARRAAAAATLVTTRTAAPTTATPTLARRDRGPGRRTARRARRTAPRTTARRPRSRAPPRRRRPPPPARDRPPRPGRIATILATSPMTPGGSPARTSSARASVPPATGSRRSNPRYAVSSRPSSTSRSVDGADRRERDEAGDGIHDGVGRGSLTAGDGEGGQRQDDPAGLGDGRPREQADDLGLAQCHDRADEHRGDGEGDEGGDDDVGAGTCARRPPRRARGRR